MSRILQKRELVPKIYEMVVEAPRLARKARPGHFVIAMAEERGERVPLTVADFDRAKGTLTLVLMAVGTSTMKLAQLEEGQDLHALLGPLGAASEIESMDTVVMVAGGVGTAPIYPIARAYRDLGVKVITIQGARSKDLLFWTDKLRAVSDELIVTTDDGTEGRKGLVTEPLKEVLERNGERRIGRVYAIGPAVMMMFCAKTTKPFGVSTVVSLNTVMIDGTGMCGGCRVEVDGQTKFTCIDGPEFDGHLIDWDQFLARQKIYHHEETCSLDRYVQTLNNQHE